jgi:hypothetical protein
VPDGDEIEEEIPLQWIDECREDAVVTRLGAIYHMGEQHCGERPDGKSGPGR